MKPENISFIPIRAGTPSNGEPFKLGQLPNKKIAEDILQQFKGSTLTNDGGSGARNGGLAFAPWISTQSMENLSRT